MDAELRLRCGAAAAGITSSAGAFGYIYDPLASQRVDELTLPNGAYITNTFDNVARLTGTWLINSQGSNLDSYVYAYNQAGQRTSVARAAGDYVNYTYDNIGELKTAQAMEAGGVANRWEEQFGYGYDPAGNLNYLTNSTFRQQFNVNSLDELMSVTNGGRLAVSGSTTSPATNVTVNTSNAMLYADTTFASTNQPWASGNNTYTAIAKDMYGRRSTNVSSVNVVGTNNAYSYDLNGNLLTDGTRCFAYDDENELISVWRTNGWRNDFVYDGKLRRRIERDYTWAGSSGWQQTNEVHFVYDGNLVVQERNLNNQPVVEYTRGNDLSGKLQGAGGIGGLLARSQDSLPATPFYAVSSYYHADGNGNVTMLVDASQVVVAKYLYDPYGNTLAQSGLLADANKYRFSSKEWCANAGLYYYLYRFYDSNLQRWVNRDPIQESGGLDLYSFVGGDPINLYDERGLVFGIPNPVVWALNSLLGSYATQLMQGCPSCPASSCNSCCNGIFLAGAAAIGATGIAGTVACLGLPPLWNAACAVAVEATMANNLIKLGKAAQQCSAKCGGNPSSNPPSNLPKSGPKAK